MNEDAAESDDQPETELAPIEFASPGRFAINNPPSAANRPQAWQAASCVLGQTVELQRFSSPEGARALALALLQQVRRSLCLYSPDLESWLYNHELMQNACKAFLLGHPQNSLRILLRDSSKVVKDGHRLLTLSRRLSSKMHIRILNPEQPVEELAYLLVDERGMLMRPEPEQIAGYALFNDPGRVRVQQTRFEQAWNNSILDPDLRSFLL